MSTPTPVLLISGSDGLLPIMSLLGSLCVDGEIGPVGLVHYDDDLIEPSRRAQLDTLTCACGKVRVRQGGAGRIAQPGGFDPGHLADLGEWWADAEAFVCGPPRLEAAVRAHYAATGRAERLHTDVLQLVDLAPMTVGTGTVRFARSGVEAPSGGTLLERAEAAGIRAPSGCRVGVCDTCLQVKLSGRTRNLRTGELDDGQDSEGVEIHLCVSVPEGDVVIDL